MVLTMSAACFENVFAANWYDGWSLSGGAVREGSVINLKASSSTASAMAKRTWEGGSKFDVEWTMSVKTSKGNGSFVVSTGQCRAYIGIMKKGITWHASDFDTKGTIKTINHDIYDDVHTYRLIGEGCNAELYIDGYYLGELDIRPWTQDCLIQAACGGEVTSVLENVTIHEVDQTLTVKEEAAPEPTPAFFEDFEGNGDYSDWTLEKTWEIKDGYLHSYNATSTQYNAMKDIVFNGDFVWTGRIKSEQDGFLNYFALYWYVAGSQIDMHLGRLDASNHVGRKFGEGIDLNHEWHEFKLETFDNLSRYCLYIDDVKYIETEVNTFASLSTLSQLRFNTWGYVSDPSDFYVDWVKYEPKSKQLEISAPLNGAEYLEGERVTASAEVSAEEKPASVDFTVNGKKIATGYAPDYTAVIDGLCAGNYEITATTGDLKSETVTFSVVAAVSGELGVTAGGNDLTVKCDLYDKFDQVARLEYLVDGVKAAEAASAPYSASIKNVNSGRHIVTAVAYTKSGLKVFEASKSVLTDLSKGKASMSYANEIHYKVGGNSGSAVYELKNGNHYLKLTHTADKVAYLTDTGEETFDGGTGEFIILTEGPTADVYQNGQLAFSFYMPQTSEVKTAVTEKGLKITEKSVTVPEERKSYFVKRDVKNKEGVYHIPLMPYIYNLDFVAGSDDELRLVVNDGYFKMDLEMEDGKFYVWTMHDDNTEPERKCIADIPSYEGDAYFRVETTAGMSRLYANGRWLASFRCLHTAGGSDIAIDVTKGDGLRYIALSDNNDIFLYNESFKGEGEFDSEDYLQTRNGATSLVDKNDGVMIIDALDRENAIVELFAFAGQSTLSADVEVKKGEGGIWLIANHNTSDVYTKIGYSFENGRYEVVSYKNGAETVLNTASGDFPISKTVNVELRVNELDTDVKTATLYVDGVPVICDSPNTYIRGRVGFAFDDTFLYLKNISYRGDAKPLAGMAESITDKNGSTGICFFDMIETDGKISLIGYGSNRCVSTDNGKTWTEVTRKEMDSFDNVRLQSGNILGAKYIVLGKDDDGNPIKTIGFYLSKDDCETWEHIATLPWENVALGHKQNSLRQGPSGRLYFVTTGTSDENFGDARVWVSDDDGLNWRETAYFDGKELNLTIAESTIIESTDGMTRIYFRSNTGYISYFESSDKGETWDQIPHSTPFLSPANMYNIDYSPEDPNTLYIAWGYDNAGLDARVQFDRSRWGVAKSTDGGKTWEFVGTYHENVDGWNQFMNLNVLVSSGCVIAEAACYDGKGRYTRRIVSQDRAMEKPVKKFERLHLKNFVQIENTEAIMKNNRDRALVVYPEKGNILLSGSLVAGGAFGEYLRADYAAAYIGAELKKDASGNVLMKLGSDTESFGAGDQTQKDGQIFVKTTVFAEKYGLNITNQDGIQIISPYQSWSQGQIRALRYSVDLLND